MSLYTYLMAGPALIALGATLSRDIVVRRTGIWIALAGVAAISTARLLETTHI